ncbi:hypothetical protein [Rhizobium sp. BT03]|uniref:hypothetical protein n=1 Tax=Rhizobium sp. BT03 TaxID=3045156 RepID=UPI0024B3DD2C|nr:hypothetical protein [Rhizobium sp. BT03]WHO75822.1 hypothetical protein QMO80_004925 [Rhizobium sp. BT03]
MQMAEIIQFPNPVSDTSMDIHDLRVAVEPSGNSELEQLLQARARIRSVLNELDRLSGELQACSSSTGA